MPDDTDYTPPARHRPVMIKGLVPTLPERGKIKIGIKGRMIKSRGGNEFQPPQKLDHFIVTTLERSEDGNFVRDAEIHDRIGEAPKEIAVRLLYDDPTLNFPTRYAAYKGRSLWCSGDGETALRLSDDGKSRAEAKCPCFRQEPGYTGKEKCKMNGVLSALIDGAGGIGGVWKFRTTSYNSIVGLMSSMSFLRQITGGPLANLPLKLVVRPKQAQDPDGNAQTIYVVGLEFSGDIAELQKIGHHIALERATTHVSIANIEAEARRLLSYAPADTPLPGDDAADIVEEFYPEQVQASETGEAPGRPQRGDFTGEPPRSAPVADVQVRIVDQHGEEVGTHRAARAASILASLLREKDDATLVAIVDQNGIALATIEEAGVSIEDIMETYFAAQRRISGATADIVQANHPTAAPARASVELPRAIDILKTEDGQRDYITFGTALIAGILAARTREEFTDWQVMNLAELDECEKRAPKVYSSIARAIAASNKRLSAGDRLAPEGDGQPNLLTGC